MEASLLSLAVAEAPHAAKQDEIRQAAVELFREADFDVAATASVFDNAGIERRTVALPLDAYTRGLSFEERNRCFIDVATRMLRGAADRAVPPETRGRVTHVVLVSNTGVATPSLDCAVMQALGIQPDAQRLPVFGLGCAGGVAGLQIARDLARSSPDALVLLLCVELTSLTLLADDLSRRNFVACSLFADGAAAALVGAPRNGTPPLATLGPGLSRLFPDSHDLMGWDVRQDGWRVVFSPRIPGVVRANVRGLVSAVVNGDPVRCYAFHPGGRKVLEAYRDALGLHGDELAAAAEVLRRNGNMSSSTVFFVLDRLLHDAKSGRGLMAAFGPGFSAQLMALDVCAR
jgi:alkylresorcinol/alkylpyrone synthase